MGSAWDAHDVETTKLFRSAAYHSFDVVLAGHIRRHQVGPSTHVFDLTGDSSKLVAFGWEVIEGNVETISSKTKSDAAPNTLSGSGNESDSFDDRHDLGERM